MLFFYWSLITGEIFTLITSAPSFSVLQIILGVTLWCVLFCLFILPSHLTPLYYSIMVLNCVCHSEVCWFIPHCLCTEVMGTVAFWIPPGTQCKNCIVWVKYSNYRMAIDLRCGCVQSFRIGSIDRGLTCWLWIPLVSCLFRDHAVYFPVFHELKPSFPLTCKKSCWEWVCLVEWLEFPVLASKWRQSQSPAWTMALSGPGQGYGGPRPTLSAHGRQCPHSPWLSCPPSSHALLLLSSQLPESTSLFLRQVPQAASACSWSSQPSFFHPKEILYLKENCNIIKAHGKIRWWAGGKVTFHLPVLPSLLLVQGLSTPAESLSAPRTRMLSSSALFLRADLCKSCIVWLRVLRAVFSFPQRSASHEQDDQLLHVQSLVLILEWAFPAWQWMDLSLYTQLASGFSSL